MIANRSGKCWSSPKWVVLVAHRKFDETIECPGVCHLVCLNWQSVRYEGLWVREYTARRRSEFTVYILLIIRQYSVEISGKLYYYFVVMKLNTCSRNAPPKLKPIKYIQIPWYCFYYVITTRIYYSYSQSKVTSASTVSLRCLLMIKLCSYYATPQFILSNIHKICLNWTQFKEIEFTTKFWKIC
jgi:hypothetical protein